MKRTYDYAFLTATTTPIEGCTVLELLVAGEHLDLLGRCIAAADNKGKRVLMNTCKTIYRATCDLLKTYRYFGVSYLALDPHDHRHVIETGRINVPVGDGSWPIVDAVSEHIKRRFPPTNANRFEIRIDYPIELDLIDPVARAWWNNGTPLLPLDVARAHAKEKRKRELDAWAREAGLLPLPSSALLNLPAEPWH